MGQTTIEWTSYQRADGSLVPGYTFNPWRGCTKVSEGCRNCYAMTMSGRNPAVLGIWGPQGSRPIAVESYWKKPIKWNRDAERVGERRRVFCASLADVFEGENTMPKEAWSAVEEARDRLWQLIEATPMLDWLLLTKRPENIGVMIPVDWHDTMPANVWLGTSAENQEQAEKRIPELTRWGGLASVLFLSCEPLLGPLDLEDLAYEAAGPGWAGYNKLVDWIIAGGESGAKARPMSAAWVRSLRDQCQAAGVAFHMKQWGEWLPFERKPKPDNSGGYYHGANGDNVSIPELMAHAHEIVGDHGIVRLGKKAAGRMLDGRTWDEFPASIPVEHG